MKRNSCKRFLLEMAVMTGFITLYLYSSTATLAAETVNFSDTAGNFAYNQIESLFDKGAYQAFLSGGGEAFLPSQPITRAEFLSCLLITGEPFIDGLKGQPAANPPFDDYEAMPENFKPYVKDAYHLNIAAGKSKAGGLYFGWSDAVTRQEAVVLIGRLLDISGEALPDGTGELNYQDKEEIADWAVLYISAMSDLGIINGYPDGTFKPGGNISRAEASVMIYGIEETVLKHMGQYGNVSIFAGTGSIGYRQGDRLKASFVTPQGLFMDENGVLYITDSNTHLISTIERGSVSFIAGAVGEVNYNGVPLGGYQANSNPKKSRFNNPGQAVKAADGSIYITDRNNNAIRKIDGEGKLSTVAGGSREAGYLNGPGESALFNAPFGIAVGKDGTLYVADTLNHCIRMITPAGEVSLYAGEEKAKTGGYKDGALGTARFNEPTAIVIDDNGVLYVADSGNSLIRMIKDSNVTTLAGAVTAVSGGYMAGGYRDGPAASALFNSPKGICLDSSGNLYVSDTENNRIRKLALDSLEVSTVAGTGEAGNTTGAPQRASFNKPMGITVFNGKIYIADSINGMVKSIEIRGGAES